MFKNELRPYEISLWTLQDSFISVLKPLGISSRGQMETPKSRIKNDGTQELSFIIPMYYRENGELIENPIWYNVINGSLIANLRKLKLIFNKGEKELEQVFEFVIQEVTETHTDGQLKCKISAEGLAFQELGKTGYKISLSENDFYEDYDNWFETEYPTKEEKEAAEPKNNIDYWCRKIFKNSYWDYQVKMDWSAYGSGRQEDKIYEDEFVSSWNYDEDTEELIPARVESLKEKYRLVNLQKSNIYNLTQNLAKTFGVYCKYEYKYDENYHIKERKCVFYNNFISQKNGTIDIIYPYGTSKIERKIESEDIVTKLFITPMEDNTASSGLITIADVPANKSKEDYILNFDYLYSIGTISKEQYEDVTVYERSMYIINTELEPLALQQAEAERDLVKYEGQLKIIQSSIQQSTERMNQANNAITAILGNSAATLYKNLDNPLSFVLTNSNEKNEQGKDLYYIKITTEGVDTTGKVGYVLKSSPEGETVQNVYGIRLYYYQKTEDSPLGILTPYLGVSDGFDNGDPINSNYKVELEKDSNGNLVGIKGLVLQENMASNRIVVTFAYQPKIYYENIYNTFARRLAKDKAEEQELTIKINALKERIEKVVTRQEELLEEKENKIADFERMMGPALREGSWQAEEVSDAGDKFVSSISSLGSEDSNLSFMWDEESFEDEFINYQEIGAGQEREYYPCISLISHLEDLKNNLDNFSLIYTIKNSNSPELEIVKYLTIGSQIKFAFVKQGDIILPTILIVDNSYSTDRNFYKESEGYTWSFQFGVVSSSFFEDQVRVEVETLSTILESDWIIIQNENPPISVFPRIEVKSLLLKTSEDELILKLKDDKVVCKNYNDYYVLIRDNSYFISPKENILLRYGKIEKGYFELPTFELAYSLSNASLSLYLDALEVSKTNAFPKVSYTLKVSALNESFIGEAYKVLNRIVSINDSNLKLDNVYGYISEIELDLDSPWQDSFTVQNYKTKFEDLFSTIVASTEQLRVNSFSYNNAASAFGPGGTLKPSVIQNTINQTDLTYAFQNGNLTIDEVNGIWARSDAGVVAIRGGGIFCATQQDGAGNWLWNTGIMPSGINASLITAGQIDTNLIKIYAGDNLRLQLNQDGLFAYKQDSLGEADLNYYVTHNSEGLFLVRPKVDSKGQELQALINKVEISWDGLILRNNQGNSVFYANNNGDLTITGTITAKEGNIGKWQIVEDGLQTENGRAGIFATQLYDDEGNIIDSTKGDNMIWVTGLPDTQNGGNHEFRVTNLGELYCSSANIKGTVAAGSFVGNTEVGEVDSQLRTIRVAILDGTSFMFTNYNYDGILKAEPEKLKFRIYTNALTEEELTPLGNDPKDYVFSYGIGDSVDSITQWHQITLNENSASIRVEGNNREFFFWEPNYLTFHLKNAIMYLGKDNPSTIDLNSMIYLKVEKYGKQRVIENGKPVYKGNGNFYIDEDGEEQEESFIYSDTIQLVAETFGLGKFVSQISPPSYTFIEDFKDSAPKEQEIKTFTVELTGFTMEEVRDKAYWRIEGEPQEYHYAVMGSETSYITSTPNQSAILTDSNAALIINGEEVSEDENDKDTLNAKEAQNTNDKLSLNLNQEENKIFATASINKNWVPQGGNVEITFCIDSATRTTFCFRVKNGADGINIVMRSSSGTTLDNGDTKTDLSVEVYYSSQLMNGDDSTAKLFYVWKKDGEALSTIQKIVYETITNEDTQEIERKKKYEPLMVTDEGEVPSGFFEQKTIGVFSKDFELKADYRCDVFNDLGEAKAEYLLLNENLNTELKE